MFWITLRHVHYAYLKHCLYGFMRQLRVLSSAPNFGSAISSNPAAPTELGQESYFSCPPLFRIFDGLKTFFFQIIRKAIANDYIHFSHQADKVRQQTFFYNDLCTTAV